jgi:hypothetical protein
MANLLKPVVLLTYIALLLSACAPVGYIRPGMTEEEVTRDLSECAKIARDQAFRDIAIWDFRFDALHPWLRHRHRLLHRDHAPSLGELKNRYRRVCMLARGYQLAPISE